MKNKKNLTLFLAIGVAVGVATHNLALWIAVGLAIGVALDARAVKQDRQNQDTLNPDDRNRE